MDLDYSITNQTNLQLQLTCFEKSINPFEQSENCLLYQIKISFTKIFHIK